MIKLTIDNQAKVEASWEIINDDLNFSGRDGGSDDINGSELKPLYKPFANELRQVFGQLPEINDFEEALTHLFSRSAWRSEAFNADQNVDVKQARHAFKVLTRWVLDLVTKYSKAEREQILIKSLGYKDGSVDHFKNTTFNLNQ